jgi:PAS domain S-box-containing protein
MHAPLRVACVGDLHRDPLERGLVDDQPGPFSLEWVGDLEELSAVRADCVVVDGSQPGAAEAALETVSADVAVIAVGKRTDPPDGAAYIVLDPEDLSPRLLRRMVRTAVHQRRTEYRLRRSERQLAEAQRVASLGSWEWDIHADRITWSDELYRIMGVRPRELDLNWDTVSCQLHPDDVARTALLVEQALATGEPYSVELRIIRPGRQVRWLHLRGEVTSDENGERVSLHGTAQDITRRVEREAARRVSDEGFHSLFHSSLDAMLIADDERRFIAVNPAGCDLLGASATEVCSGTVDDFTAPDLLGDLPDAWTTFLVEGRLGREWAFVRPNGDRRDVEMGATARVAPGQHLAILHDVTVRKRTEQELARRLDQQAAVARLGGRALAGADLQSLMAQAADDLTASLGAEFCSILEAQNGNELLLRAGVGWSPGLVGSARVPADTSSITGCTLSARGPLIVEELNLKRFPGSKPLVEHGIVSLASVVIEGPAAPFGVVVVHSKVRREFTGDDVSFIQAVANVLSAAIGHERAEQLESRLRQRERLDSVGQLAGGIAHDFNNLLSVILNYTRFALGELDPERPDMRANLEEVLGAAQHGAQLTNQLLVLSRRDVVKPETVDVNAGVGAAQGLLTRTLGEHIDLRTELHPHMPAIQLGAGQLEQIVLNLALNARDAMPGGGSLTITTGEVKMAGSTDGAPQLPAGRYVLVSVSDTGSGMTKDVLDQACDPFFTTKARESGTGLGLATVYAIATEAGGAIAIDSEPGQGTTVDVYLPAGNALLEVVAAAPDDDHGPCGQDERVLLVEDEPRVRALTERILRSNGYRVTAVDDGLSALDACRRERFDLLLTDVVMPKMSGEELTNRMRTLRPRVRVLFMSGYPNEVISPERLRRDAFPLLPKPFTPRELLEGVREALVSPEPADAAE